MSRYAQLVTLALLCSVALNGYLLLDNIESADAALAEQELALETSEPHAEQRRARAPQTTLSQQSGTSNTPDSQGSSSVSDTATTAVMTELNSESISQARAWLAAGEYGNVEAFIQRMSREHFDNPDLLLLEADWLLATQPLSLALTHFYGLLDDNVLPADQQEVLATRVESLRDEAIRALYEGHEWDMLAQFIEPLFQLFPTDRSLILLLAESYAQQQKYVLMEDTLASLPPDHPGAEKLRSRMQTAQTENNNEDTFDNSLPDKTLTSRVSLEKYGEHYLVDVNMQGTDTKLLLDTGASSTAINRDVYRRLQRFNRLQMLGLFDVNTAGGPIRAPLVRIESLTLGPYTLKDVGVLVLPRTFSGNNDGLLGMNVLKQFRFQLDQDKAELVLAARN